MALKLSPSGPQSISKHEHGASTV